MRLGTNLSVCVTVDEIPEEEFGVTTSEDGRNTTCWIASETGKTFAIQMEDVPTHETSYDLKIDGRKYAGKVVTRNSLGKKQHLKMEGRAISATELCPFTFANIGSTDDDSLLGQSLGTELGDIVVTVYEAILTRKPRKFKKKLNLGGSVVHERLKKGVDHQMALGTPKQHSTSRHSYRPQAVGELLTFRFKYRPLAVLRANGIAPRHVPRTSPAVLAQSITSADVDTEAKLRKLKARKRELELQRLEDEIRDLEGAQSSDRAAGRVKREPNSTAVEGSSRKKVKRERGVVEKLNDVIDLTLSD